MLQLWQIQCENCGCCTVWSCIRTHSSLDSHTQPPLSSTSNETISPLPFWEAFRTSFSLPRGLSARSFKLPQTLQSLYAAAVPMLMYFGSLYVEYHSTFRGERDALGRWEGGLHVLLLCVNLPNCRHAANPLYES